MDGKNSKESFVVIGPGRVGTAMAKVLVRAGYDCLGLFGRDPDRVKAAGEIAGARAFARLEPGITREADIVLVAVPDDVIAEAAADLVRKDAVGPGAVLIHFSGLVTSEALAGGRGEEAGRASAHPNLAFADPAAAAGKISGVYFGVEGNDRGVGAAERIVQDIGGIAVRIPSDGKVAYHLAAVFASNGMVVLASISSSILSHIGVKSDVAEIITARLMLGTAQNLGEFGVLKALTGPVVRGDHRTVAAHMDVLGGLPSDLSGIYRRLFRRMVDLSISAKRGTKEKYESIINLLEKK
ncbi:MAG: DUF2520 domain-containing protein [Pseudomonadota bacterium]